MKFPNPWDLMSDKTFLIECSKSDKFRVEDFDWDDLQVDSECVDSEFDIIVYDFPNFENAYEPCLGAIMIDLNTGYYSYTTLSKNPGNGYWNLTLHNPDGSDVPFGVYLMEPTKENYIDILINSVQFNFTGDVRYVFKLPEEYVVVNNMPEDPEKCLSIGRLSQNAECFIQLFPIDTEAAMPFNKPQNKM